MPDKLESGMRKFEVNRWVLSSCDALEGLKKTIVKRILEILLKTKLRGSVRSVKIHLDFDRPLLLSLGKF
jgi:hypothetical protein